LENGSFYETFTGPNTLKIEAARLSETLARENIDYNAFCITWAKSLGCSDTTDVGHLLFIHRFQLLEDGLHSPKVTDNGMR
jgi:hypothetical protein